MKTVAYGLTDVGRRRESNQDSLLMAPERGVYAVADGMGGHAAGEVASHIAIEALSETLVTDSLDGEVESYIELMRFNADEIARCLGGPDG